MLFLGGGGGGGGGEHFDHLPIFQRYIKHLNSTSAPCMVIFWNSQFLNAEHRKKMSPIQA